MNQTRFAATIRASEATGPFGFYPIGTLVMFPHRGDVGERLAGVVTGVEYGMAQIAYVYNPFLDATYLEMWDSIEFASDAVTVQFGRQMAQKVARDQKAKEAALVG